MTKIPQHKLLKTFKEIDQEDIPTVSATVGISNIDQCKIGDGKLYDLLLVKLKECDTKNGKKKRWENQPRDILIAETCIKNNIILVTNDVCLTKVMKEFNGHTRNLCDFLTYRKLTMNQKDS